MTIIDRLLAEAHAMTPEKGSQWAYTDIDGDRLAVNITNYNGGDGQQKKINTRTVWAYRGKSISIESLRKANIN